MPECWGVWGTNFTSTPYEEASRAACRPPPIQIPEGSASSGRTVGLDVNPDVL